MTLTRDFVRLSLAAALALFVALPTLALAAPITYTAAITVTDSAGTSLGYVANSSSYLTPPLTNTGANALIVTFTLDGPSGTQMNLTAQNPATGFALFGLVQGRDNTSTDIGPGSFNYLYLTGVGETDPGATPQTPGNYASLVSGQPMASESAVWTIDVAAGLLRPVWVNADGSTPDTVLFVQAGYLYGGGDAAAFHNRFPAAVTPVTLGLDILSAVPQEPAPVPEPSSLILVAGGVAAIITGARRPRPNP